MIPVKYMVVFINVIIKFTVAIVVIIIIFQERSTSKIFKFNGINEKIFQYSSFLSLFFAVTILWITFLHQQTLIEYYW